MGTSSGRRRVVCVEGVSGPGSLTCGCKDRRVLQVFSAHDGHCSPTRLPNSAPGSFLTSVWWALKPHPRACLLRDAPTPRLSCPWAVSLVGFPKIPFGHSENRLADAGESVRGPSVPLHQKSSVTHRLIRKAFHRGGLHRQLPKIPESAQ